MRRAFSFRELAAVAVAAVVADLASPLSVSRQAIWRRVKRGLRERLKQRRAVTVTNSLCSRFQVIIISESFQPVAPLTKGRIA